MRHWAVLVPSLICLTAAGPGGALAQENADAFAREFVGASLGGDGLALARLVHPETLEMLAAGLRELVAEPAVAVRVYGRLGVEDRAGFDALDPADLYARLVFRSGSGEAWEEFRRTAKVTLNGRAEEPRPDMVAIRYTVVGTVDGRPLDSDGVLRLKLHDGAWLAWPAGEIELVLRALGAGV